MKGEVARMAALLANVGCEREARSAYCAWVKKRAEAAARSKRLLAEKEVRAYASCVEGGGAGGAVAASGGARARGGRL
jgi:hypothetical protein